MNDMEGDLAFLPLGGTGEIGLNLNLYRCDGRWLAIDCGLGFGGSEHPEVDIMVPDPAFIADRRDQLVGLVITVPLYYLLAVRFVARRPAAAAPATNLTA